MANEPQSESKQRRFTKADAKLAAFGVLAVLAGIFIGQNTLEVKISFVFFSAHVRLIWVFLLCIVIGVALDRLLTWRGLLPAPRRRRARQKDPAAPPASRT